MAFAKTYEFDDLVLQTARLWYEICWNALAGLKYIEKRGYHYKNIYVIKSYSYIRGDNNME